MYTEKDSNLIRYLLSALQAELANMNSIQTTYTHSTSATTKGTFFQWHVIFMQMHQERPPTLLRDALSWLTRTAMTKEHEGYEEESQPAH